MSGPAAWTAEDIARLRSEIEVTRKVRFWGQEYEITPQLVDEVFGDGRQLIFFEPLNTRPDYYVVLVDSAWDLDEHEPDDWREQVLLAIGEQFGERDRCDCSAEAACAAEHDSDCATTRGFPTLSPDSGWLWGEYRWPVGFVASAPTPPPSAAAERGED